MFFPHLSKIDRIFLLLTLIALTLNIVSWIVFHNFPLGNGAFILHFKAQHGIDFLGSRQTLKVIPAIATIIFIINSFLAFFLRKKDAALVMVLASINVTAQTFLFVSLLILLSVNEPH